MLWVVVCFHSRRLTICKHSCVRHISWAFPSAISGKQTMFTNLFVNILVSGIFHGRFAQRLAVNKPCLQIIRCLLWKQTTTHSIRNNNPMFDGNLLLNLYVRLSTIWGDVQIWPENPPLPSNPCFLFQLHYLLKSELLERKRQNQKCRKREMPFSILILLFWIFEEEV